MKKIVPGTLLLVAALAISASFLKAAPDDPAPAKAAQPVVAAKAAVAKAAAQEAPPAKAVVNPMTDMSVYPIAVWAMDAKTAPAFAEMGVNIFVGDQGNPVDWCNAIARSGCGGFVHWTSNRPAAEREAIAKSPGFFGWMHGDEPDNPKTDEQGDYQATGIKPQILIDRYEEMKKSSTPAPMYLNLGVGLAVGANQTTSDATYRDFMKCADIVCYDVYPVSTQDNGANRLHLVARGIARLKNFAGSKPAWIWLECGRLSGDKSDVGNRAPYPHELRAEIWMSIIWGADGIGYFPHQFTPYRSGPASIPDELQSEMKLTGHLLHKLAPVLRTGKKTMLTVSSTEGRVDAAAWEKDGELLVVAVNMKNSPARATLPLPAGAKEMTVVGQSYKAKVKSGALADETFRPYEARLYWTGPGLTNQNYSYPEAKVAAAAELKDVRIDFEAELPKEIKIEGDAKVVDSAAHDGKKALQFGELSVVTIPLTEADQKGRVTMWIYDSSKQHSKSDELKPTVGPTWGLVDSKGRLLLFGVMRRSFLTQESYSFTFGEKLYSYPSPGHANINRTQPGWYKWEFDFTTPGQIVVTVNGKPVADLSKNLSLFDNGFHAIKIVGGQKGEPEQMLVDDITVEYPKPRQENPGRLVNLPFARDNRKGVLWSRTHNSRLAAPMLAAAPKIDGDLSDPAWKQAQVVENFTNVAGTGIPTYSTVAALGQFGGKLYLAFRCNEDFLGDLVTNKKAGWQNDCIELQFDPDNQRTSAAHFVITASGAVEASRLVRDEWGEGRRDDGWKPGVEAKAGRLERAWTLEVAIDLKDLGDVAKSPVWGFDMARERKPAAAENSAWTLGGFNAGAYFGELSLAQPPVTLANARLENRTSQEVVAQVEVTISDRAFGKTFASWEEMWFDLVKETVAIKMPPGGSVSLLPTDRDSGPLARELYLKVPPNGRIKFTLVDPQPMLSEEFIANVWGQIEKQ